MTQRVIKYRAWDGERMYISPSSSDGLQHLASWFEAHSIFGPGRTKESIIMTWTGLLDKHGKEIYEGDILKFIDHKHETRHIGPVVWGRYEMSGFDIPTWTAKNGNRGGIGLFPVNFKKPIVDMEVIGNIYTTPELVDPKMIEHGNS